MPGVFSIFVNVDLGTSLYIDKYKKKIVVVPLSIHSWTFLMVVSLAITQ